MRPPCLVLSLLCALVALLLSPVPAALAAAFVLYFQPMGGWSVLCWRDEPTAAIGCSADAPPPSFGNAPAVVVHVTEVASGAFAVTLEMRANVPSGATATITVDGGQGLPVTLDRDYMARVEGARAGKLVADMLAGQRLIVDAPTQDGNPVEAVIALESFSQAFEKMRLNLRSYGVLR